MQHVVRLSLALSFSGVLAAAAEPASSRAVDLAAPDGTKLAATFYAGARPGPGILLLHQCNRDRSTWKGLAEQLAGQGFQVMTLDYRGYGESGGARHLELPFAERRRIELEKWSGDIDTAYAYLRSQPGVTAGAIGAGGASCGVNQSIQLARRHPEVKSLVLLSGTTDREGRQYLRTSKLPLLIAAADDDGGVVQFMDWIDASSGNPANRFLQYAKGGHGTDMFQPRPELPGDIVSWYEASLPGKPPASRPRPVSPTTRLLVVMDEPEGPGRVAATLAAERKKDPKAAVLAPGFVNQLGYEALQGGDTRMAVAIMQGNADAHPKSSNAWDSLADAYLADGQREKALQASQKSLTLVDADTAETEEQRKAIRQSAQGKLDQLKGPPPPKP